MARKPKDLRLNRKKELEDQIFQLHNELTSIIDEIAKENNSKFVGKCYKLQDSFYGAKGKNDYWFIYCKVLRGDSGLRCLTFQSPPDWKVEIDTDASISVNDLARFAEITQKEFDKAWKQLLRKIEKIGDLYKPN